MCVAIFLLLFKIEQNLTKHRIGVQMSCCIGAYQYKREILHPNTLDLKEMTTLHDNAIKKQSGLNELKAKVGTWLTPYWKKRVHIKTMLF